MTDQGPLIVSMGVEALVVNDHTRTGKTDWMRTEMNYNQLPDGLNGALQPASDPNFVSQAAQYSAFYNGVYLKWRLPRAFTRGRQDAVTSATSYPPIPNRWLVIRTGGPLAARTSTAWIVESDFAWPLGGSLTVNNVSQWPTLYPRLFQNMPWGGRIGRNYALDTEAWSESGASLGLTAMAPGNPAFASYQPNNNNVLSFVDPLAYANEGAQSLGYTVIGWFSDPAEDPLASAPSVAFEQLLEQLNWTLPAGAGSALRAGSTLLYGSVGGVAWQTDSVPAGGPPDDEHALSIAVGNSSIEALTSMVAAQADAHGTVVDAALLEAFQLDAIDLLDQPDGAAQLADRVQASFFKKFSGGYSWSLVPAPNQPTPPTGDYGAQLATLNKAQAALDAALLALSQAQGELYVAWWKSFSYAAAIKNVATPALSQADIAANLAAATARVNAAKAAVDKLAPAVPQGASQADLQAAIVAYQTAQGIPTSFELKRSAAPRYFLPNDPVVMVAGAGAAGIVDNSAASLARFPSQLVTGFMLGEQKVSLPVAGLATPRPDLSRATGIPISQALLGALLDEAFLLDPDNAAMIGAALHDTDTGAIATAMTTPSACLGSYPVGAVRQWTGNPWHPLLLMYQAQYYGMPYGSAAQPNWEFVDGAYALAQPASEIAQGIFSPQGTIMLAPTAASNMKARLTAFIDNNPSLTADQVAAFKELLGFVSDEDSGWDLMSQALDGFNNELLLVQPGLYVNPYVTDGSLAKLIGDGAANPPGLGPMPEQGAQPASQFQPWRAGQFYLDKLILVDEWGQALWPITSQSTEWEHIYLPPELTPVLQSVPASFTVAAGPTIDSVSPTVMAAGGPAAQLQVTGSGFVAGAVVQWNGTPLATVANGDGLVATVPASSLAAGTASVSVRAGGTTSAPAQVEVAAGPAIGALAPALIQAGMAETSLVPLTVTGANFASDAAVHWNGRPLDTVFDDAATLTAQVPSAYLAAPGPVEVTVATGGKTSAAALFTVSDCPVVTRLTPASALAGGPALSVTIEGVGFSPMSCAQWQPSTGGPATALATTYVSPTRLTAALPAAMLASAGAFHIAEAVGSSITPTLPISVIQLPPALLQPARLLFDLRSSLDDGVVAGPANPGADPVCGWVLPNHLDGSIMAYDNQGVLLGEMSIDYSLAGQPVLCWDGEPGVAPLATLAQTLPHFGPFLASLYTKGASVFQDFLAAIDETLWTTQPMGAVFDKSLSVLVGRPLAMVRAALKFDLAGQPCADPSWQYTLAPATPAITSYQFSVELGNIARLDDGLVGYFLEDDYDQLNVVLQANPAADGYLKAIDVGNYLALSFAPDSIAHVSMLVDPRAPVHATTAILPTQSLDIAPRFVDDALAAMQVCFRLDAALTETRSAVDDAGNAQVTLLLPIPSEKSGSWDWVENDNGTQLSCPTAPIDAAARLANEAPVLRQGKLRLSNFNNKRSR